MPSITCAMVNEGRRKIFSSINHVANVQIETKRLELCSNSRVQLRMMNRHRRTLDKHLNGYFLATWHNLLYHRLNIRSNTIIETCCGWLTSNDCFFLHLNSILNESFLEGSEWKLRQIVRNFLKFFFESEHDHKWYSVKVCKLLNFNFSITWRNF